MTTSLTQAVKEAGFKIIWESSTDNMGIFNIVTLVKDGKRTKRKARKYEEALEKCAKKFGINSNHAESLCSLSKD